MGTTFVLVFWYTYPCGSWVRFQVVQAVLNFLGFRLKVLSPTIGFKMTSHRDVKSTKDKGTNVYPF